MKKKNLNFLLALLAALALVFAGACSDGSDDGGSSSGGTENEDGSGNGNGNGNNDNVSGNCSCNTTGCTSTAGCQACADANCTCSDCATQSGTVYCDTCEANTCTVTTDCTGAPGCSACAEADPTCECDDCAKTEINLVYFKAFVAGITDTIAANDAGTAYWTFDGGSWDDNDLIYTLAGGGTQSESQVSASTVIGKVNELGDSGKVTSEDGLLEVDFSSVGWEDNTATGSVPGQIKVTVKLTSDAGTGGSLAGTYEIDSNDESLSDLSDDGVEVTLVFDASDVTNYSGDKWTT